MNILKLLSRTDKCKDGTVHQVHVGRVKAALKLHSTLNWTGEHTAVPLLWPSHIHTLPRGSPQSVSHIWNDAVIHIETFSVSLHQLCPRWNLKRLSDWPSSAAIKDRGFPHRAPFVFWGGLPVIWHYVLDNHILFIRLRTLSDDTKSATESQWIVWPWEHGGRAQRSRLPRHRTWAYMDEKVMFEPLWAEGHTLFELADAALWCLTVSLPRMRSSNHTVRVSDKRSCVTGADSMDQRTLMLRSMASLTGPRSLGKCLPAPTKHIIAKKYMPHFIYKPHL